jgi:hypothetical protein
MRQLRRIEPPLVNTSRQQEGMFPNTPRGALRDRFQQFRLGRNQIRPGVHTLGRRSGLEQMRWNGGPVIDAAAVHGLDATWLRDNCQCALCRDPASGQRLTVITDHGLDVTVTQVAESADRLDVTFGPDGHQAAFTRTWLAGQTLAEPDARSEDAKRLWSARDFPAGPTRTPWIFL